MSAPLPVVAADWEPSMLSGQELSKREPPKGIEWVDPVPIYPPKKRLHIYAEDIAGVVDQIDAVYNGRYRVYVRNIGRAEVSSVELIDANVTIKCVKRSFMIATNRAQPLEKAAKTWHDLQKNRPGENILGPNEPLTPGRIARNLVKMSWDRVGSKRRDELAFSRLMRRVANKNIDQVVGGIQWVSRSPQAAICGDCRIYDLKGAYYSSMFVGGVPTNQYPSPFGQKVEWPSEDSEDLNSLYLIETYEQPTWLPWGFPNSNYISQRHTEKKITRVWISGYELIAAGFERYSKVSRRPEIVMRMIPDGDIAPPPGYEWLRGLPRGLQRLIANKVYGMHCGGSDNRKVCQNFIRKGTKPKLHRLSNSLSLWGYSPPKAENLGRKGWASLTTSRVRAEMIEVMQNIQAKSRNKLLRAWVDSVTFQGGGDPNRMRTRQRKLFRWDRKFSGTIAKNGAAMLTSDQAGIEEMLDLVDMDT